MTKLTTPMRGADWAWARPTADQIHKAQLGVVIRYSTPATHTGKRMLAPEKTWLRDIVGVGLGSVFETTASRCLAGRDAGVADAIFHRGDMRALGFPDRAVAFKACDSDQPATLVRPYFDGAKLMDPRSGPYGSDKVVVGVEPDPGCRWQTVAWSHGRHVPAAAYQHVGSAIPGVDTDYDDIFDLDAFWMPHDQPATPPVPSFPLFPGILRPGDHGPDVSVLKLILGQAGFYHPDEFSPLWTADVTRAMTDLKKYHDLLTFLNGVSDLTRYWGRYTEGVGKFDPVCGELSWAFLSWMHQNKITV